MEFVAHYVFDCKEKLKMVGKCGIYAVNLSFTFPGSKSF